jgi:hypothetical protein
MSTLYDYIGCNQAASEYPFQISPKRHRTLRNARRDVINGIYRTLKVEPMGDLYGRAVLKPRAILKPLLQVLMNSPLLDTHVAGGDYRGAIQQALVVIRHLDLAIDQTLDMDERWEILKGMVTERYDYNNHARFLSGYPADYPLPHCMPSRTAPVPTVDLPYQYAYMCIHHLFTWKNGALCALIKVGYTGSWDMGFVGPQRRLDTTGPFNPLLSPLCEFYGAALHTDVLEHARTVFMGSDMKRDRLVFEGHSHPGGDPRKWLETVLHACLWEYNVQRSDLPANHCYETFLVPLDVLCDLFAYANNYLWCDLSFNGTVLRLDEEGDCPDLEPHLTHIRSWVRTHTHK